MADAEQLAMQFEQGQRRLQALDRHLTDLEMSLRELRQGLATLESLDGDGDVPSLVPVGGGLRVHARVDRSAKVVLDVGAGYAAELSPDAARDRLQARRESAEAAHRATSQEIDRIAQQLEGLRAQLSDSS